MDTLERRIRKIITLLTREYGEREWKPRTDAVGVLVQTILSQNTSDTNSDRAFDSLRNTFPSWEEVAAASPDKIASAIVQGGLSKVKAVYIKNALEQIKLRHGSLELDFLKNLGMDEARMWLRLLPGVGQKTANCILLFSLGMPALPVDTHVYRVTLRLGLVAEKAKQDSVPEILEPLITPDQVYAFHVLIIEHGRKVCIAGNPRCRQCILGKICPSFPIFTGRVKQQKI
jgi:endonuclease III